MALSTEVAAWLEDLQKEGSLDEAAFNALKATFENEKVGNFVKGSVLRQADYSRQSGAIQKAQKELEDAQAAFQQKQTAVDQFNTELITWKGTAEGNFNKAIADREKAERTAQTALARLKSLAAANGLSEEEVLKDIEVAPVPEKKVETQNFDTSKFVSREDIQRGAIESVLGEAAIADIADEVMALTGNRFNRREFVAEAVKAGKTLDAYAEQKFGLTKLREDKANADIQKRIDDGIAAGVTAQLSAAGIPGNLTPGRSDLRGSPVLSQGGIKMPGKDQQPGGGVPGAVAAFQAGKYAQK